MLHFNSSGLLVPNRNIRTTFEEFRETFVNQIGTLERKKHFEAYLAYSNELKSVCGGIELMQWVNGSFVTIRTEHPKDIDLVTFIDFETVERIGDDLIDFMFPNSENKFGVDAYILKVFPEGHKKRFVTESDRAYWMDKFDKTRRNNRGNKLAKGFVELVC